MTIRSIFRISLFVVLLSALLPGAALATENQDPLGECASRIDEVVSTLDSLTPEMQRQYALTVQYNSQLSPYDTTVPYPAELTDTANRPGLLTIQSTSPSSYDSRKRDVVSPVKNQGALGVCWSFAIAQAAEASYLSSKASTGETLDLSEWQLAYFMYNRPVDELSNTVGDTTIAGTGAGFTGASIGTRNYYNVGGNAWLSMFGMANGIGYAHEDSAPYDQALQDVSNTGRAVLNDDKCYQSDAFLLENAYTVSPTEQPELMKSMIMEKGAGTLQYASNTSCYRFAKADEDFGASYYNPNGSGSGHLIAVIGWDDSYSRDNFGGISGNVGKPRNDGAWLVKNSWGDKWGDEGYFWMSYEEPSLSNEPSLFVDVADNTEYDHAYYYDGTISYEHYSPDKGITHTANIFTAKQNETLEAVSFFTVEQDVDYEVEVYLNPSDNNPTSGTKVVSGVTGSFSVPGYHSVKLADDQYVDINQGDTFSVVVKQTKDGGATTVYADKSMNGSFFRAVSAAHVGESFISRDGTTWVDFAQDNNANARIKAFTCVRESSSVDKLAFDQDSYRVEVGTGTQLNVLSNGEVVNTAAKLDFTTSDSSKARIDGLGVVYAKDTGTIQVTASRNGETATCEVEVIPAKLDAITKAEGYATQESPVEVEIGSTVQLEYATSPERMDIGLDWELERVDSATGGYSTPVNSVSADGLFTAQREGLYKATATYENADETTVAQEFYVKVFVDVVECDSYEKMAYKYYDNVTLRSYVYTGEKSETGYVIGFDKRCALEDGYDFVYVIGSDSPISGQLAYDCTQGLSYRAPWCKSFTGKGLAGAELVVPHPYIAVVLKSDQMKNDWGFAVTSLRPLDTQITYTDGTFTYDGQPHSITASCAVPGAIIEYGTEEGTYNLASCPAYTDAGTYDVFIRAKYSVAGNAGSSAALSGTQSSGGSPGAQLSDGASSAQPSDGLSGAQSSGGASGSLVAARSTALLAPQVVTYEYSYATAKITIVPASLTEASLSNVKTKTYNARAQSQSPVVTLAGKRLKLGVDYTVSYQNAEGVAIADSAVKAAGSYYVVVRGMNNYKDSARAAFAIKKAANSMEVAAKSPSVAYSKKSKRTIVASKAFDFTGKARGPVTYARLAKGSSKYLSIGEKGKITVAKKTPRGKWKIRVRVKAAGNANYKAKSATVTVFVKVK